MRFNLTNIEINMEEKISGEIVSAINANLAAVVGTNGSLSISSLPIIADLFVESSPLPSLSKLESSGSLGWKQILAGGVQDVAYGTNGIIWICGTKNNHFGGDVKAYDPTSDAWSVVIGSANRIALGPTNLPYVVTSDGDVYSYDLVSWT
jgi:hypothetical protein